MPVLMLLLLPVIAAPSLDFASLYDLWADRFEEDIDPNVGMTSFPSLLIPVGGRYEGMGTAATASSGEAALIEANPAGSAAMQGSEIAFHHREWIGDTSIEEIAYAASFGPFGMGVLAKHLYTPFTAYDAFGERAASGYFSETVGLLNASLSFVSTPRFGLAMGVNAKIAFRYVKDTIAPEQSAYALPLDLGLLVGAKLLDLSPADRRNLSLGVALKNFGFPRTDSVAPLPTVLAVGLEYSPFAALRITGDVTLPLSLDGSDETPERIHYAAGAEVLITPFLSIHAGAVLKPGNPRVSLGTAITLGSIELVTNYAVDLMNGMNPLDTFSLASTIALPGGGREAE